MERGRHVQPAGEGKVRCLLCRHRCLIPEGSRGICGVRENRDGTLISLVYGRVVAEQVDPVEKKPLYHFLPGSRTYSIATQGCNFRCRHCQNASISQVGAGTPIAGAIRSPEEIVDAARSHGCRSISYTYTEPTVFYEFAFDTARLAHERGIRNVFVTNGYIESAPLREIVPFLDAANIDLKGFTDRFYREIAGASLEGVLQTIREYHSLGVWIEITTLLIPGLNDSDDELRGIARFIAGELGPHVPWHVSRFFPTYRLTSIPPTPESSVVRAVSIGKDAGLFFVYGGNMHSAPSNDTHCHQCGLKLISRWGYNVVDRVETHSVCPTCGAKVPGVW